jgi:hypothetical protein
MSRYRAKPTAVETVRRLRKNGDCLEWDGGKDGKGYGSIHVGQNRYQRVHRYLYQLLVGPLSQGDLLLHSCDNKLCCNIDHLREGTNAENMRDKADRSAIRSRKLDRDKLLSLRRLRDEGRSYRSIGQALNLSHEAVRKAYMKRTYYGAQYE